MILYDFMIWIYDDIGGSCDMGISRKQKQGDINQDIAVAMAINGLSP